VVVLVRRPWFFWSLSDGVDGKEVEEDLSQPEELSQIEGKTSDRVQCEVSVCRHYRVVIPRSGYRMASVIKVRPTAVYFTVLRWHVLFLVFLGSRGDPSAAFSLAKIL
jgi:hypothetical protein